MPSSHLHQPHRASTASHRHDPRAPRKTSPDGDRRPGADRDVLRGGRGGGWFGLPVVLVTAALLLQVVLPYVHRHHGPAGPGADAAGSGVLAAAVHGCGPAAVCDPLARHRDLTDATSVRQPPGAGHRPADAAGDPADEPVGTGASDHSETPPADQSDPSPGSSHENCLICQMWRHLERTTVVVALGVSIVPTGPPTALAVFMPGDTLRPLCSHAPRRTRGPPSPVAPFAC